MGNTDRRQFFQQLTGAAAAKEVAYNINNDAVFQKYANKELPKYAAKATSGLNSYTGSWGKTQAIHLLRRATFGVKSADVNTLAGMSMDQAVDYLLNNLNTNPAPPVNNYETANYTDPTGVPAGQTWINAPYGDGGVNSLRRTSLKAWWIGMMVNENLSIQEKMTFFWQNHFGTQLNTVGDARMCYNHHMLMRINALGNFKALVKAVTKDPAMLKYLNGDLNGKAAPDENYGRELQELFTVGKYNNPNYTEADVKAAARVLTGWRINTSTMTSYFDPAQHDTSNKQFGSFYNNSAIAGKTGMAGAEEADQLVDMICSKFETAKYICTKLYRYFVYYIVDNTVETTVIEPLAQMFMDNNYDIKPVIAALLKSQHFYDVNSMGCYIKTPMEYTLGVFRTFGVQLPASYGVSETYNVWSYLRSYSINLGMDLGDPANVSGYPCWYQTPQYYELWINSATLPNRMLFTDMAVNSGLSNGPSMNIKVDVLTFTKDCANAADPDALVDYAAFLLLGAAASAEEHTTLKNILLSGQQNNSYWTSAWTDYMTNPDVANTTIVQTRLASFYTTIMRLAEFQLS